MIRTITDPTDAIRILREILDTKIYPAGLRGLKETAERVQKRMQEPGQPVRYPIQWDSERQRRAFFATDGFGHGIPYRRTGKYNEGWRLEPVKDSYGEGYQLVNKVPYARYVGGLRSGRDISPDKKQSSIHAGRWPLFRTVADEEILKTVNNVISEINRSLAE
jgi:hypothetical protein